MVRRAFCIILLFKNGSVGLKSETERTIFESFVIKQLLLGECEP